MAQPGFGQCAQNEKSDRWKKVDNQAKRTFPDDDGQPDLKQIVVIIIGRKCIFVSRKTKEDGTFTVTCEATKESVSKTIQGSVNGAWILDTLERTKKTVNQAELAEQELTVCTKRGTNTSQ